MYRLPPSVKPFYFIKIVSFTYHHIISATMRSMSISGIRLHYIVPSEQNFRRLCNTAGL